MEVNAVSGAVVDSAMKVHSALGPGLLESAYEDVSLESFVSADSMLIARSPSRFGTTGKLWMSDIVRT